MVSKCANPSCSAIFRYLREGKIFHVVAGPRGPEKDSTSATSTHERFWLCGECSTKMTVISDGCGILVVPLPDLAEKRKQERARGMAAGAGPESLS
jgi:hypothetical protein